MTREPKAALDALAFQERDSIPGLQLISCQEVGLPFYLVRCKAQLKLEVEAPPLHAVVLRLLALRERSVAELARLLRLKPRMVAAVVRDMEQGRFVSVTRRDRTPDGEVVALQSKFRGTGLTQWLSQAQVHDALVAMDGLTGDWMPVPGPRTRLPLHKLQELSARAVSPLVDEPSHDELVGKAFAKHVQVSSLGNLRERDTLSATVLAVDGTELWYVRAQLLAYGSENQVEDFRVFWRNARRPDWEAALQEGEADDLRPIPTEPEPTPAQPQHAMTPPVAAIPKHTLSVWEHRPTMVAAIETAESRLMIVSPWINSDATDEHLLRRLEDAVKRGVHVFIGYGIADETGKEDKPPNPKVMQRLNAMTKNKKLAGRLMLKRLVTHEKILLKDDDLYVIGSFNWLSFRGDRKRGLRRESSALIQDPNIVRAAWADRMKDFPPDS